MAGGGVLERQGALDHRAHRAGRHQAQGHLELAARCADRAANFEPAPVDRRHVHFDGRSGHFADQHDAAAGRHRAPHLMEYCAAHGIDRGVDAASARRRAHALGEAAVDRHDDGIGAGLFKRADFGLRTGRRHHEGADGVRDLHCMEAEPAGAGDQHALARLHPAGVAYCVEGGPDRAADNGAGREVHVVRGDGPGCHR